ncbi:MAG: asparaginase [Candidatus Limnocylindrales bacterium]
MPRKPRVAILFTGGTISSVVDDQSGGAVPTLSGIEIAARTPGLDRLADIITVDHSQVPSVHLSFEDLFRIHATLMELLADSQTTGAVLVQGTDTLEESAFFIDLLYDGEKPIVVTGAMRTADAADFDGARNLQDAVICAATPSLRGQGVIVVMAGAIEPADDVVKTHSTSLTAFRSPNLRPLGRMSAGKVDIRRAHPRRRHVDSHVAAEPIPLIEAAICVDGGIVRATHQMRPRGIVVEATGSGNTHPDLLEACAEYMREGVPVVLTTRACGGRVTTTYSFAGGGAMWIKAGALTAGYLNGPKARIALALGVGADLSPSRLASLLAGPEYVEGHTR